MEGQFNQMQGLLMLRCGLFLFLITIGFKCFSFESFQFSNMNWKRISLEERSLFRSNQSGPNFSPMIAWNPNLLIENDYSVGALLGIGSVKSVGENLIATRYGINAEAYIFSQNLFPELFVGAETWSSSKGYTSFVTGLNIHWRPHLDSDFYLDQIDSLFAGYQALFSKDYFTNILQIGIQIKF